MKNVIMEAGINPTTRISPTYTQSSAIRKIAGFSFSQSKITIFSFLKTTLSTMSTMEKISMITRQIPGMILGLGAPES